MYYRYPHELMDPNDNISVSSLPPQRGHQGDRPDRSQMNPDTDTVNGTGTGIILLLVLLSHWYWHWYWYHTGTGTGADLLCRL